MSSRNWLVRRDLNVVKEQQLDRAQFDGDTLILRFGDRELIVKGKDLQIELKGIK